MRCRICDADLPEGAMFCGECGSSTSATPESRRRDPRPGDTEILDRKALTTGVVSVPVAGFHPIAEPAATPSPARFVLRFSTGETRTVSGSGLVGRRPVPQPGEQFDHLVQIGDRTLSVSKTHLEFGEHDGVLWIADRFSGNGTIVRRPDDGALRCEPGRRYLVPRGSTVELADQSFEVE
ncbi:hypothetical protein GE115_16570 [Agromyces sp. CFH 90414]|uniref:FHA domain-containing protein n=1 Tax=Agromyces agglutinans TaxID=2662258 RepID=A0A6I2FHP0_9MICO|nr:hypothetical protein [Agromyces agglutinans]MRG61473.1 hypothetical protein [Agromyces agglutinans]